MMAATVTPRRILIHGLNYSPDIIGISKFTGEAARWLAGRGHHVRVVTAPPYYPAWEIGEGYQAWQWRREADGPIPVLRCPLWVPSKPSGLARLLHLASFALSSLPAIIIEAVRFQPDVIFTVQPTLMATPSALLAAKLTGAVSWMHVQDFEVDAAFSLGLLKGARARKAALALERALLSRFDRVSSISPRMCQSLIDKGTPANRVLEFRNWVNTDLIRPLNGPSPLRRDLGLGEDVVVALYSGNMANKQGLPIIIDAARRLEGQNIYFLLCGDGPTLPHLRHYAAGLGNLAFLPLQPAERLNDLLNAADIHLLPQLADAADLVLPSKLAGMFASGRPTVATAHAGTTVALEVRECGEVVPPEDPVAFAAAIAALAADPDRRRRLGAAARLNATRGWALEQVLGRFEQSLEEAIAERTCVKSNC